MDVQDFIKILRDKHFPDYIQISIEKAPTVKDHRGELFFGLFHFRFGGFFKQGFHFGRRFLG